MKAYVFLAPGFEETEAIAPIDMLRRGGVEVELVAIDEIGVDSSHGVNVSCESEIYFMEDIAPEDIMIFPGGMPGSKNLASCGQLMSKLNAHYLAGGCIAAICAAPAVVLADKINGLDTECTMTCYPGFEATLTENGVKHKNVPVVSYTSENGSTIITARSAAAAIEFGLTILAHAAGKEVANKVAMDICLQ